MNNQSESLKQTLANLRQALEDLESALIEFEEGLDGQEPERPTAHTGIELLSIPQVCQELGMAKSWVYREIKNGEIPSIKLGRTIKVPRRDLEAYLEQRRYHHPSVEP
jgi:excisionase family DNA binding protein